MCAVAGMTFILSPHHKNSFAEHFNRVGCSPAGLADTLSKVDIQLHFSPILKGGEEGNRGSWRE